MGAINTESLDSGQILKIVCASLCYNVQPAQVDVLVLALGTSELGVQLFWW